MAISYGGIGAVVATFHGAHEFESGTVVAVVGEQTVGIPTQGEPFDGVIFDSEGTLSAVQIKGFVTVRADGKIEVGRRKLVIDAEDSVQEGEGNTYLVVASTKDTVTFLM